MLSAPVDDGPARNADGLLFVFYVGSDLPRDFRADNLREWPLDGGEHAQVKVQGRADRGDASGEG